MATCVKISLFQRKTRMLNIPVSDVTSKCEFRKKVEVSNNPHNVIMVTQPERIDPQRARGYDVRSDVWSLGITLMEVATGYFPYPKWNSVFEQLYQVVQGDPPRLSPNENGNHFTMDFVNFVNTW